MSNEILLKALEIACANQIANTYNLNNIDIKRQIQLYIDFYIDKAKDFLK